MFDLTKANPFNTSGTKSRLTPYRELGVKSTAHSGGIVTQDFLHNLRGRRGVAVFNEMYFNDPVIGGMMFAVEQILRQITWAPEGSTGTDEKDKAAKKFLVEAMDDMEDTWDNFVSDAITFLAYGWSIFEKVYKIRKGDNRNPVLHSKHDDNLISWRNFEFRSQTTLDRWEFDDGGFRIDPVSRGKTGNNKVIGFVQRHPNTLTALPMLPMEKAVLFRTKAAGGNPEGVSVLRNAYRPWFYKKRIEEIEGIGIERDLAGLPMLTPPEDFEWEDDANSEALAWAKEVITHVRRDEYEGILMPGPEWKFELISSPGTRQFDTSAVINRYNKVISLSTLSQFLMLGMERVGSYALVKSISDLWYTAVDGWVKSMEETIDKHAVEEMFKLNPQFAGVDRPRLKASRVNMQPLDDLTKFLGVIRDLVDLSDPDIQNALLRAARLPLPTGDKMEESRTPPEFQRSKSSTSVGTTTNPSAVGGGAKGDGGGAKGENGDKKGNKNPKQKVNGREQSQSA